MVAALAVAVFHGGMAGGFSGDWAADFPRSLVDFHDRRWWFFRGSGFHDRVIRGLSGRRFGLLPRI